MKLKITKQYDAVRKHYWFYGYRCYFWGLISIFICVAPSYEKCKEELLAKVTQTKEEIVERIDI